MNKLYRKVDGMKQCSNNIFSQMISAGNTRATVAAVIASVALPSMAVEVDSLSSLQAAVVSAKSGDTITLKKGTYTFSDVSQAMGNGGYQNKTPYILIIDKDLTIEGKDDSSRRKWQDHAEPVIINANGIAGFASIAKNKKVTFKNITFTGGTSLNNYTAPFYTANDYPTGVGNVVLTNCILRQNTRSTGYSGTFVTTLKDCLITNNTYTAIRASELYACDIIDSTSSPLSIASAEGCTFRAINATVLGGDINRISNCIIENCSFHSYISDKGTYQDCVFRTNILTSTVGSYLVNANTTVRGCTFEGNSLGFTHSILPRGYSCTNCTFTANTCQYVADNPKNLIGCTFESNLGKGGGTVVYLESHISSFFKDCTFARNKGNYDYSWGVGIYMKRTDSALCSLVVTNCIFEGNYNTSGNGGAIYNDDAALPSGEEPWDNCTIHSCTFTTNAAGNVAGVYGVKAINCVFDRNLRHNPTGGYNTSANAASRSYLIKCDFNDADLCNCILEGCRIHDIKDGIGWIFNNYTRCTNSLIENCVLTPGGSLYRMPYGSMDAKFVNCTFVNNTMYTYDVSGCSVTNGISFINCLFNGNKNAYYDTDFEPYKAVQSNPPDKLEYITFANTYFGEVDQHITTRGRIDFESFTAITNTPNTLTRCENPGFVGQDAFSAERYPDAPYWSLSLKSPLLGKGAFADWMTNAKDIAGNPRAYNGSVDVGCYQCWLIPLGTTIIVR